MRILKVLSIVQAEQLGGLPLALDCICLICLEPNKTTSSQTTLGDMMIRCSCSQRALIDACLRNLRIACHADSFADVKVESLNERLSLSSMVV